ncbi:hypothetical protein EJ06DRAFT_91268 [Trichodelitschia bisporula]|uniref:Uncharacterized protein n=1 Tax=Trichodelitschia bisporula TaxID=703511 RepID=A0A6G1HS86_9PEZI|nr:hypothetical protein EJ06DRAFT_91268 [Trichodelitschia bisporula]
MSSPGCLSNRELSPAALRAASWTPSKSWKAVAGSTSAASCPAALAASAASAAARSRSTAAFCARRSQITLSQGVPAECLRRSRS